MEVEADAALPVTLMLQVPEAPPPVVDGTLKLVRASAAVEAPVPPSAIAKSVIPVMLPPLMLTLFEFWVAIEPRPMFVRAVAASVAPVPPFPTARAVPDQLLLLIELSVAREPRPRLVRAVAASVAPVPPFATDKAVPDQFELLIELSVDKVPKPKLVRAVAASVAPVPPLPTANAVPDQFVLLMELRVAKVPRPKFVRAPAAVDAPVPPSAIAKSVMPVIEPPVMLTLLAFCVDMVPKLPVALETAVVTKAVVAIWVVFVPAVAVGAIGVPVREGEAKDVFCW